MTLVKGREKKKKGDNFGSRSSRLLEIQDENICSVISAFCQVDNTASICIDHCLSVFLSILYMFIIENPRKMGSESNN